MGLWILEPRSDEKVPGTVHFSRETEEQQRTTANLKHGTGRFSKTVLVPQPSDSPNDPLNWSTKSKYFHSIFLSTGTGLMTGTSQFVNPAQTVMANQLHTTVTQITRSVSIMLLLLGVSAVVTSPIARVWGKRPVLVVGNIVALVGYIIIISKPESLTALYAGRAIHGLGVGPIEYLVSSSVGDLFFVHQRAFHLAIWHFALQGGNNIGQVIGGQIVQRQDWVWAFRYVVILMAVYSIALFLFIPETTYNRHPKLNTDFHEQLKSSSSTEVSTTSAEETTTEKHTKHIPSTAVIDVEGHNVEAEQHEKKKTYLQGLKLYNGRFSNESLFRSLISPFWAFLLPSVLWTSYAYGCTVAFGTGFSVSLSQVFSAKPYSFNTGQIGLTVLSAFIGALLGNAIPGPAADWLVKFMSKRNNGVYEPEFRLLLCIPGFIFGVAGFWGFGLSLQAKDTWIVPVFFFGMAVFAGGIIALVSNAYVLDCHRAYSQDSFAAVTLGRSVFSFGMTFAINNWITRDGIANVFYVIGTLHGIGCLLGLVLYVFGKRIRLAVSKSHFIQSKLARPNDMIA